MPGLIAKIRENGTDRMAEVFWMAVKAGVVTAVVLLLLRVIPINVNVAVRQADSRWDLSVDQSGTWYVE